MKNNNLISEFLKNKNTVVRTGEQWLPFRSYDGHDERHIKVDVLWFSNSGRLPLIIAKNSIGIVQDFYFNDSEMLFKNLTEDGETFGESWEWEDTMIDCPSEFYDKVGQCPTAFYSDKDYFEI